MKKHIYLAILLGLVFCSCSTEKEKPIAQSQSVFATTGPTKVVEVTNPKTGKTWMDRNLGATRAATSSTDVESYGDLYQWGRGSDGHQFRNSPTTAIKSSTDVPGNGNFILSVDWRMPQNNNLWIGKNGINNPCPSGFRLPTDQEWKEEVATWSSNNAAGAFASPLKLPNAGSRFHSDGRVDNLGLGGGAWSSTFIGIKAKSLFYSNRSSPVPGLDVVQAGTGSSDRANGLSVRCIKD
jgi:uncharacterized protein (TIGR02145 family)